MRWYRSWLFDGCWVLPVCLCRAGMRGSHGSEVLPWEEEPPLVSGRSLALVSRYERQSRGVLIACIVPRQIDASIVTSQWLNVKNIRKQDFYFLRFLVVCYSGGISKLCVWGTGRRFLAFQIAFCQRATLSLCRRYLFSRLLIYPQERENGWQEENDRCKLDAKHGLLYRHFRLIEFLVLDNL